MQGLGLASPVPREREWQLRITNDLWAQSGHAIVDAYATTLRRAFHAGCHAVAFRSDPDGVRQAINAHVAKATKDRIRDLLSAEHVTADTRVVLTNALWLKATWAEEFYNRATKPAPFTLASGERVEVPMMRRTGHHGYAETADWQCLVMAFRGGELVCEVMLPRAGKSLALAEQVLLTGAHRRGIASARVAVHLPRFRVESGAGLRATLAAMGLRTTFVPMVADFTGVSPEGQLVVGDVVHRAWIDLNEDGVEAAAATAAAMTVGSAMPAKEQPPIPFVARVDDQRPRQRG
jgi:serpin B